MKTHAFIPGRVPGLCALKVKHWTTLCGKPRSDDVHRVYPCRKAIGDSTLSCFMRFYSIESRDRHEANVHGSGW